MTNFLDPNEGETVCDPTCGSGGFLIKAFEYMREKIEDDVKEVSSPVIYIPMKNNYFTAEGNDVKALFRGKVLSSEENNGYYSLIVYYGDDLYGLYFNLVSLSCKIYDKVDKGDTLGYFEESFKALFKKGNELIDYEEIYSK